VTQVVDSEAKRALDSKVKDLEEAQAQALPLRQQVARLENKEKVLTNDKDRLAEQLGRWQARSGRFKEERDEKTTEMIKMQRELNVLKKKPDKEQAERGKSERKQKQRAKGRGEQDQQQTAQTKRHKAVAGSVGSAGAGASAPGTQTSPAQFDTLMEKTLTELHVINRWPPSLSNLRVAKIADNGDCLLHSLASALGVAVDYLESLATPLRHGLADEMAGPRASRYQVRFKQAEESRNAATALRMDIDLLRHEWTLLGKRARTPGKSLEDVHVFVLAHLLRRPIIILADAVRARAVIVLLSGERGSVRGCFCITSCTHVCNARAHAHVIRCVKEWTKKFSARSILMAFFCPWRLTLTSVIDNLLCLHTTTRTSNHWCTKMSSKAHASAPSHRRGPERP